MRRRGSQLAMAAVLFLLGFLVVTQARSTAAENGLNALSVQELTELVANLTTRNNQLRDEVQQLDLQHGQVAAAVERGDSSAVQVRSDLALVLGWSGRSPVTGSGVRVTVDGPIAGDALGMLLNELRNAGAEGIAIGNQRILAQDVPSGVGGALTIAGQPLGDPFEILAIGQSQALAGSLTRAGGPVAQLAARYPEVQIAVTDEDLVALPATDRDLAPVLGRPRL